MKKISFMAVAGLLFVSLAACDKFSTSADQPKTEDDENVVDSVAMELEQIDDSLKVENSEISIPDFLGIVEAYGSGNSNTASRHLRAKGMKMLALKNDSVTGASQMVWTRGAEFVNDASGPLALRFKSDLLHEEALALYLNKDKKKSSQIFFTDKRLVPVYVRELQSMGYELKPEKSTEHQRRYESSDDEDFMESFTIVIGETGCAVVLQYDMDDDKDD